MSYNIIFKYCDEFYNITKTKPYYIDDSEIHEDGVFANYDISPNETIGLAISEMIITDLGSKINHKNNPNAKVKKSKDNYYLISTEKIPEESEITLNYKDTPWFIDKNTDFD